MFFHKFKIKSWFKILIVKKFYLKKYKIKIINLNFKTKLKLKILFNKNFQIKINWFPIEIYLI